MQDERCTRPGGRVGIETGVSERAILAEKPEPCERAGVHEKPKRFARAG